MRKYRGKIEIVYDILLAASKGARKTHIMYKANLSYKLLVNYLEEMMKANLVFSNDDGMYTLTEDGEEFLSKAKLYFHLQERVRTETDKMNNEKKDLKQMLLFLDE